MTEPTPGPWKVGDWDSAACETWIYPPGDDTPSVAHIPVGDGRRDAQEQKSNARLIASAPDLLEALQTWQTWHANHFADFNEEMNIELLCIDNKAAAAIATATTTNWSHSVKRRAR